MALPFTTAVRVIARELQRPLYAALNCAQAARALNASVGLTARATSITCAISTARATSRAEALLGRGEGVDRNFIGAARDPRALG